MIHRVIRAAVAALGLVAVGCVADDGEDALTSEDGLRAREVLATELPKLFIKANEYVYGGSLESANPGRFGVYAKYGDTIAVKFETQLKVDVELVTPTRKAMKLTAQKRPAGVKSGELGFIAEDTGIYAFVVTPRSANANGMYWIRTRLVGNSDTRSPWDASYCPGAPLGLRTFEKAFDAAARNERPYVALEPPPPGWNLVPWQTTVRVGGFRTAARQRDCRGSSSERQGECGDWIETTAPNSVASEWDVGTVYGKLYKPYIDLVSGKLVEGFQLVAAHPRINDVYDNSYSIDLNLEGSRGGYTSRTVAALNPGYWLRPKRPARELSPNEAEWGWAYSSGKHRVLERVISSKCYWAKAQEEKVHYADHSVVYPDGVVRRPIVGWTQYEYVDYGTYDDLQTL